MTIRNAIVTHLQSLRDEKYGIFQGALLPTVHQASIIGVRTPAIKAYAKELSRTYDCSDFLNNLPHQYFEENQLHAFLISEEKKFDKCIKEVADFLPFIDNWATCDQLSPHCFPKHTEELLPYIEQWIADSHEYTVRFAIALIMRHFLNDQFSTQYHEMVASIQRKEYYIQMMQAWYFATALAKQYQATIPFLENRRLDTWTHNKAIQKAIESYRISDEHKTYLRTLKIKKAIIQ